MPSLKHKTSNTLFRFNDEHNLNKDTWYVAEKQLILFKSLERKKRQLLVCKLGIFSNFRSFQDLKAEWEISYQSYVLCLRIITRLKGNVICYGITKLQYSHAHKNSYHLGHFYFSVKQVTVNKLILIALQQIVYNLLQFLFIVISVFVLATGCFEFKVTIMERYLTECDNHVLYKTELPKLLQLHS